MTNEDVRFQKFRGLAAMVLSILLGLLITIPLTDESKQWVPLVGMLGGFMVGYRRRKSVAFFYFVIIACGVMTTLLLGQMNFQ